MYPFLPIAIIFALALSLTLLATTHYRPEDKARIYDRQFRILSYSRPVTILAWVIACVMALLAVFARGSEEATIALTACGIGSEFILLFLGFFRRKSYFTADADTLTCVRFGKVKWSHRWTDIAHVRRRIVSTGKTTTVFYDITTKDGIVHKSLPHFLGRTLKEHVGIEPIRYNRFLIILIAIVIFLFILALASMVRW